MSTYKTIGCVVTACGLSQQLVDQFMITNRLYENGIELFITTFKGDDIISPGATITEIERTDLFNIGYAANASIIKAVDYCDMVIKTDIDCILSKDCLTQIEKTELKKGFCYRYWEVENAKSIDHATINPRTMGTVCLSSCDWSNLRGYDERLTAYGYDDYHMIDRARKTGCIVPIQMDPKVYHISHEEKHNRETINPVMRKENMTISATEWTDCEESIKWGMVK